MTAECRPPPGTPLRYEAIPDEWVAPLAKALARPWGCVREALVTAAPVIRAGSPIATPPEGEG